MTPGTYWSLSFPASSFLIFAAVSTGRLKSKGEIEVVATVGAARLDNDVCTSFGGVSTSSVGKLVFAVFVCVGHSVENAVATGLKEGSGVVAAVNMFHRQVSMDDSLPLYSYNLFSMLDKEMVIAFMKAATSVVFLESAFYKECKKIASVGYWCQLIL